MQAKATDMREIPRIQRQRTLLGMWYTWHQHLGIVVVVVNRVVVPLRRYIVVKIHLELSPEDAGLPQQASADGEDNVSRSAAGHGPLRFVCVRLRRVFL
jgi:hypothetical protein